MLLEALALLDDADWNRIETVRICGGGPLEDLVHTRVATLAAQGRSVTVEGYLDRGNAAALYAWADYLVLPDLEIDTSQRTDLTKPLVDVQHLYEALAVPF